MSVTIYRENWFVVQIQRAMPRETENWVMQRAGDVVFFADIAFRRILAGVVRCRGSETEYLVTTLARKRFKFNLHDAKMVMRGESISSK